MGRKEGIKTLQCVPCLQYTEQHYANPLDHSFTLCCNVQYEVMKVTPGATARTYSPYSKHPLHTSHTSPVPCRWCMRSSSP